MRYSGGEAFGSVRVAVISDIHANLVALEAVITDWGTVDAVRHLGDTVGYGPHPEECIGHLRSLGAVNIAGNHDWAAVGRIDYHLVFNAAAAEAMEWTVSRLSADTLHYLAALPCTLRLGEYTLAHGSPRNPIEEYLLSAEAARENFAAFDGLVCFVGHSHIPLAFTIDQMTSAVGLTAAVAVQAPTYDEVIPLEGRRHIINVGSVGQPRDRDPAARYVILDTDRHVYWRRRVEYPVAKTQRAMRDAGLPAFLWQRLAYGW